MQGVPLSDETRRRVEMLFTGDDVRIATEILSNECGCNLPLLENLTPPQLDRFRFAALKISCGQLDLLRGAIDLAKRDWRDLLFAAGFEHDIHAHEQWLPQKHNK